MKSSQEIINEEKVEEEGDKKSRVESKEEQIIGSVDVKRIIPVPSEDSEGSKKV